MGRPALLGAPVAGAPRAPVAHRPSAAPCLHVYRAGGPGESTAELNHPPTARVLNKRPPVLRGFFDAVDSGWSFLLPALRSEAIPACQALPAACHAAGGSAAAAQRTPGGAV